MDERMIGWKVVHIGGRNLYSNGGFRWPRSGTVYADCIRCGMTLPLEQCEHGIYSMRNIAVLNELIYGWENVAFLEIMHHGDVLIADKGYRSTEATVLQILCDKPLDMDAPISPISAALKRKLTPVYRPLNLAAIHNRQIEARKQALKERQFRLEKLGIKSKADVIAYIEAAIGNSIAQKDIAIKLAELGAIDAMLTDKQTAAKKMRKFSAGDTVLVSRDSWGTTKRGYVVGSYHQDGGSGYITLTLDGKIAKYPYAKPGKW